MGPSVASFVRYTGEITESISTILIRNYKPGQQESKGGLEKQYKRFCMGRRRALR